jgi:ABC-2 type transport system permease protein
MHKILMVLRREYFESVKKKAFWIGTLIFPVFIVGIFGIQILASMIEPDVQKTIGVIDATGRIAAPFAEELGEKTLKDGSPRYPVEIIEAGSDAEETRLANLDRVDSGQLYGLLTIGPDIEDDSNFRLDWKNIGDQGTENSLERALQDHVRSIRLERSELDLNPETLRELTAWASLNTYQVTKGGETKEKDFIDAFLPTMIFVMMLYFMIYFHGYAMTRGIIQEKTSRVMEVLLGSVSPNELMAGKILGIGLVGLTQVSIYMITGYVARTAALFWLNIGDLERMADVIAPSKLIAFGVFYLFGYFIFVSIFAIVGAACNTDQEAQQLQLPIVGCLMLPMMTTIFFVSNPDSLGATVLSLIPIFTPMVMFMRISVLTPPLWQILLSLVLMSGTIYLFFRAAAKVFRIGTLMYGKRPTVREIWRWARS